MDAIDPASPDVTILPARREPRIFVFWGTALWGAVVFAAMFVCQIAVVAYFVLIHGGSIDMKAEVKIVGQGLTI